MSRGALAARAHLVAGFAFLLVVCIAAPVFAEPLEPEGETALGSPQAVAEREASEYAYADLTPGEEKDLLREQFAPQLNAIDADPARALADVVLKRIDSPTEALVTVDGETALLESEVPLRAPEDDGDLHKVELGLEETASGYAPANPLVDLTLPDSADDPIEIGDEGLAITPEGAGEAAASQLGEEDLFLPAVREDTSLLLSPIAGGLELSVLLASRNSPQQLSFDVALPQGATLRGNEAGGAEVVDAAGGVTALVTPPRALDAQGREVPVTLSVEGGSLVLSVLHREMDVAYPLFVDPEIIEDWSSFSDTSKLGYWKWAYSGVGAEDFIGKTSCIVTCWGNGLYLRARSSFTYPGGSWARWWFTPQGSTTFMRRVILGPINYDAHGCWANEPHPYVGVWNDYTGWVVLGNAYPTGWASSIDTGAGQNLGAGSRTAFVGIQANGTVSLNCGRDYRLGGATLFLDDPENPTVGATSGYPAGWVKSGDSFTINGPASDPGLGLKTGKLILKGSVVATSEHSCNGHYSSPCPASHTFQFPIGAATFDEGEKSVDFVATDALGKPSNPYTWALKVDRTPPEIDLAGQLAQATDETEGDGKDTSDKPLPLPVYNLTINATDGRVATEGNPITAGEKRSGVKKIQVYLDAKTTPEATWEASSCAGGNCPLSKDFTLKLNELSADVDHYLRVLAYDFAGNAPRERKIEFEYIPATGIRDEYVMQYFPLPDGSGNEAEEEHPQRPELAVNLVSGNLVYRQTNVDVEGPAADLELELYYNSLLPDSQDTEWGDGWTLTQTPQLELEDPGAPGPATEAIIVEESGSVESRIDLPVTNGEENFDKRLQATIAKEPGGYELSDESGETEGALAFDESGRVEELRTGTAATVDYDYEAGALAEISVEDPGTVDVNPEALGEDERLPDFALRHSANFGASGSADGQLKTPADVALDAKGNVWVLDRGNGRIQKFGPDGQFISKFGSAGTGDGQLNSPSALAIDGAGNLWVAENHRVQKFSPTGQSLLKFGSQGLNPGQFWNPSGIAIGSDGTVWVSDAAGVQRFTASGQFIERVGLSGPGQLAGPQSLDADSAGNVFVADANNDRIVIFDKEGDYVRSFGAGGSGAGQFENPTEVDVDSRGTVWVADNQAGRVQAFDSSGEYLAQFGSTGAGAEQFKFEQWSGVASDGQGRVWIADPGNNRLGRWLATPITGFFHSANFGSSGSADGQLSSPADVAADSAGNLWVLDRGNGRVQKFGPDGQFISKFGSAGTGDGQFSSPSALAIDAAGNVLVIDNHRVQKFSPSGEFLSKFGSQGTGQGQFWNPNGIAVGIDGTIWVSDGAGVQRFTAGGQFIERVGTSGSGPGQISLPQSLDVDQAGNVFVAEAGNDRISVFDREGDYVRSFGASGSGAGQFENPTEVEVDSDGQVWVGDSYADRIQLFTGAGDYIAQFGSTGTGAEQLKLEQWTGIASDKGQIWIADTGNDRLVEWIGGQYDPATEPIPTEDDPQLEVNVSEGLVESVAGDEAGEISYEHSGELLTAVTSSEGEADFEYENERLTKVTLPNGTYAQITYEATYGRVKSVTVAPQGANPKTTYFDYSDEPRRTTVTPPDAPITTYDIAADGSIFKWWNTKQPPVFDDIGGTLGDPLNQETSQPIAVGTHTLNVQAHDDEGVRSIQIVANNSQLVDEKTCEAIETKPSECTTLKNEWVTETGNWPPGILYLEVIATDRLGESVSERWWVNIPYTPPPDPEAEEPPRFAEVLQFREEFGLDLDLKGDESAINDRIFDLIGDWHNPNTPAGEVARVTDAKWGVPLRAVDAAELEYRQRYIDQSSPVIQQWAAANAPSIYSGYYVDDRAGGIIRVGFTSDQDAKVSLMKASNSFMAPNRIASFVVPPSHSLSSLEGLASDLSNKRSSAPSITHVAIDQRTNAVKVGASNLSQVQSLIDSWYGQTDAIVVYHRPRSTVPKNERERLNGPMRAGDRVVDDLWECTLGFGVREPTGQKENGQVVNRYFALTAGHCFEEFGEPVYRTKVVEKETKEVRIGNVARNGLFNSYNGFATDGEAIKLRDPGLVPRWIQVEQFYTQKVQGVVVPQENMLVCTTGITSDTASCGRVRWLEEVWYGEGGSPMWQVNVKAAGPEGNSGGPVWDLITGAAVGLTSSGPEGPAEWKETSITPLLPIAGAPGNGIPGILSAPGMGSLKLVGE